MKYVPFWKYITNKQFLKEVKKEAATAVEGKFNMVDNCISSEGRMFRIEQGLSN